MVTPPIAAGLSLSLLLVVLLTCRGSEANRSLFGEPCNKTVKCDSAAWLACHDGTCECLKQNEMLFDPSTSKCVSKAGERCKYALERKDEQDNLISEVTPCVQNATCNPEGICACDTRFHENITGLCTYSQGHAEPCDAETRCSLYQGLHCQNGFCACDEDRAIYSEADQQCVGRATFPCINSKCAPQAMCGMSENICSCNEGYYLETETKLCKAKVGPLQNCSGDDECLNQPGLALLCVDGVCNCDPTVSMYASAQRAERYRYDPDIFTGFIGPPVTQCVGLAGEKCLDRLCVPRAYCSYSIIVDFSGICKCLPGYKQTKLGRCGHDYQEACTTGDSCFDGFVCKDKRCSCTYDNQAYDPVVKGCYSKIGGPCGSGIPCGRKARCVDVGGRVGHCECQDGYVENVEGECEVAFGGACDESKDCDSLAQLQCINAQCQCSGFARFSSRKRTCLGLVGARCDLGGGRLECVENAYCREVHPKLQGICTCEENFNETSSYECA